VMRFRIIRNHRRVVFGLLLLAVFGVGNLFQPIYTTYAILEGAIRNDPYEYTVQISYLDGGKRWIAPELKYLSYPIRLNASTRIVIHETVSVNITAIDENPVWLANIASPNGEVKGTIIEYLNGVPIYVQRVLVPPMPTIGTNVIFLNDDAFHSPQLVGHEFTITISWVPDVVGQELWARSLELYVAGRA
jgi:hypothetical protein